MKKLVFAIILIALIVFLGFKTKEIRHREPKPFPGVDAMGDDISSKNFSKSTSAATEKVKIYRLTKDGIERAEVEIQTESDKSKKMKNKLNMIFSQIGGKEYVNSVFVDGKIVYVDIDSSVSELAQTSTEKEIIAAITKTIFENKYYDDIQVVVDGEKIEKLGNQSLNQNIGR